MHDPSFLNSFWLSDILHIWYSFRQHFLINLVANVEQTYFTVVFQVWAFREQYYYNCRSKFFKDYFFPIHPTSRSPTVLFLNSKNLLICTVLFECCPLLEFLHFLLFLMFLTVLQTLFLSSLSSYFIFLSQRLFFLPVHYLNLLLISSVDFVVYPLYYHLQMFVNFFTWFIIPFL